MTIADRLYATIRDLVMCHSPSGVEHEVDAFLAKRFEALGIATTIDPSGNLIARIAGRGKGRLVITAHKDEIGALVSHVGEDGKLTVRKLGGSFPWVYGEGVVDVLGERETVTGILSFGSRHVSHASPQFVHKETAPLKWSDAWIETKLGPRQLESAGVRPGTRVVIGKHRKAPVRIKDYIASYALDDKASLAILLELAERVKDPAPEVFLVATAKEEIGALGAMYLTQRMQVDALIALEVTPIAPEYSIEQGTSPVLLAEDSHCLYDDGLNALIRRAAASRDVPIQSALVSGFGSDGSLAMKGGNVPKAACLGFPTENTHGFEIAHLGAIANCVEVLDAVCQQPMG